MMALTRQLKVLSDEEDNSLLRIAFATSDGKTVDQHFGSAMAFAVYGVGWEEKKLLEMAEFGSLEQDGNEDKLVTKLRFLEGCVAVYCRACGASAVRQLLELNVQPIKVSDDTPIADLISALQAELKQGPSSWLARAIKRQSQFAPTSFDDIEAEGWND